MPYTQGLPANRAALLDMIAASEGTTAIPGSDDGYKVIVGSTPQHPDLVDSYADHPFNAPNMVPVHIAGVLSTASGRYQVIRGMYEICKVRLGLPDFSPASQDAIALEMLREKGALDAIDAGYLQKAILLASSIWASLPGSRAGQRTQPPALLIDAYRTAGGSITPYAA